LIGDSSLLEYAARGRCDLQVLRGPQTNRYLSLASPVGCVYRDRLSLSVLQLLERGRDGASHRELGPYSLLGVRQFLGFLHKSNTQTKADELSEKLCSLQVSKQHLLAKYRHGPCLIDTALPIMRHTSFSNLPSLLFAVALIGISL